MTETATPSADAGATGVSIPVPSAAVPPTTNAPAAPEAAPDTAKADAGKSEETTDEQPRAEDGKFKPKSTAEERKARIQGDIDRLTAEKRSKQRELESLTSEYQRIRQQMQEQPAPDDPYDPRHATRQAVREDRLEQTAEAYNRTAQDMRQTRAEVFRTKIEDAKERIPDLDKSLETFWTLPVPETMADLIAESDKAAEIANLLGKTPSEFQRIARLPPHLQGAEIARIEAKVSQAPQARKSSNAPPPPPMINGSSSPTTKAPSEMSVEEMGRLLYARA